MNKFHAKKTQCSQGHWHDSGKEADYCSELAIKLRAGEISGYETQVSFELQPAFVPCDGAKKIRAITIVPDFVVFHLDGVREVVDVKGYKKGPHYDLFKVKWKMLTYKLMASRNTYAMTII